MLVERLEFAVRAYPLLNQGASYADIAHRMGVRPTTVIDHVRKMYTRLDVID